jgi:chromosome segregation and condensation protein ScpB
LIHDHDHDNHQTHNQSIVERRAGDLRQRVAKHAEDGETTLESALEELRLHYDIDGHGVELVEVAGGWQILTRP